MSRMTRALAREGLVTIVCVLLVASPAHAGGGPQNVLIIYNANPKYPDGHGIAEHYRAARGIHPDQMLGLSIDYADLEVNQPIPGLGGLTFNVTAAPDSLNAWNVLTVEEFTHRVYNPIVAHLAAKGLEDQVHILVFCKGMPWRIWPEVEHDHPLSDAAHPDELNGCAARPEGGFASVLARASFGNTFDLSPGMLEHVFEIDTSSLALGRHTVMVVAMDGGAAEAQGYFHAEFELSETLEVVAAWADDIAWCYENAPQHTGDRHQVELHVAVGGDAAGQGDYEVTVETLSGTTGEVSLEATDDPLLWRVIGGPYDQAAGTVRLGITVRDRAGGATGETECTMVVRRLGDIDNDGGASTTDKLAINRALNGLPQSIAPRAIDITGDGIVDTQDRLLMARILNGLVQ